MARNGSGTFSLLGTLAPAGEVSNPTTINAIMDDIATALTDSVNTSGTKAFAANQSMGGFKATSLGDATARTDAANAGQVQDGKLNWIDGGGTADAITATYTPALTALLDGQLCHVRATAANATTTPTFAPNGLMARTIVKFGGSALGIGNITGDGHELILRYDLANTRWELLNPGGPATVAQTITINNAATNTVTDILKLAHTSTGTVAASFGAGLLYQLENDVDALQDAASIDVVWTDETDATEDSKISFKTMVGGAAKAEAAYIGEGIVVGAATDGDQGAGTVNAENFHRNGVALPANIWTTRFKTANETINSDAALSMDTDLRIPVADVVASAKFAFRIHVWYQTATAADFRFGINGPASPTLVYAHIDAIPPDLVSTTLSGTNTLHAVAKDYLTGAGIALTGTTETVAGHIQIEGIFQNGANSTEFGFTWSQNTSDAGNTTVLAGSYIEYCLVG